MPLTLRLLPAAITALELRSFCTDELPSALARFSRLQRLDLTGNAASVNWSDPSSGPLVPLLHKVRALYGSYLPLAARWGAVPHKPTLPESDAVALAAASRLQRLDLQVERWADSIGELCEALPALRDLRCRLGGRGLWSKHRPTASLQ